MPSSDQITALTELSYSNIKLALFETHFRFITWKGGFDHRYLWFDLSRSAI